MRWTIAQVADALGTRPGTGLNALAWVAGVSIDSRAIRAGELFIAIHGPRHDGHDHVASALESGAIAAVVAHAELSRYAVPVRDRCIRVADTFDALKQLARAVRESWGGKIAGVTGSVGKTTTKEILAALLGAKLRVLKSEGNLNNEYGDRKSTRLNSSHSQISYAVFCLKKKKKSHKLRLNNHHKHSFYTLQQSVFADMVTMPCILHLYANHWPMPISSSLTATRSVPCRL